MVKIFCQRCFAKSTNNSFTSVATQKVNSFCKRCYPKSVVSRALLSKKGSFTSVALQILQKILQELLCKKGSSASVALQKASGSFARVVLQKVIFFASVATQKVNSFASVFCKS